MSELTRLQAQISKIKQEQAKKSKLSNARGKLRELKYGKYFKPGRRAVGWIKKKVSGGTGQYGGNDMFSGLEMGNPFGGNGAGPLEGIGPISMGNPFGQPERHRTTRRHLRRIAPRRPVRHRYTWVRRRI